MTRRARIISWTAGASVVLVMAGAAAFTVFLRVLQDQPQPTRPDIEIPAAFRTAREVRGHRVHLDTGEEEIKCEDCHGQDEDALASGESFEKVDLGLCTDCHDELAGQIHPQDVQAPLECTECHTFADPHAPLADDCMRCHAKPQKELAAVERHVDADCASCHSPHGDPSLQPGDCNECHEGLEDGDVELATTWHHEDAEATPDDCLQCHDAHGDSMPTARQCAECHLEQEPQVLTAAAATFRGHDECTTCHDPHAQKSAFAGARCGGCHGDKATLAASSVELHARCGSCHSPHNVRASARQSCTKCHGKVSSDHPSVKGPCAGCHEPHPPRATEVTVLECSSCHDAPSETSWHADGMKCSRCHEAHEFQLAATASTCAGCHRDQSRLVARRRGHAECTDCHTAAAHHPARAPKQCGQCHAEPARTAPGGHRECTKCHSAHDGELVRGARSCTSCHAEARRSAHSPPRVECTQCHRPHGPGGVAEPPRCASCHRPGGLPGLHKADPEHRQCASCHRSHERQPRADRASCTSCHEDMTDHQPEASSCSGCHVFRRGGG